MSGLLETTRPIKLIIPQDSRLGEAGDHGGMRVALVVLILEGCHVRSSLRAGHDVAGLTATGIRNQAEMRSVGEAHEFPDGGIVAHRQPVDRTSPFPATTVC